MRHSARAIRWWAWALLVTAVGLRAQTPVRHATTLSALLTYPVFYHGKHVIVRAPLTADEELTWLRTGARSVLCLNCPQAGGDLLSDVAGTFWDIGRLEPGDPRLTGYDVATIAERRFNKPWPAAGELAAVVADRVERAEPAPAPTVRTVALEPERYQGQRITVAGRFRGRNLYGDLPELPRQSRWEFVLQSADSALWVTGLEPRGMGFSLDIDARVDTSRWVEVTGTVNHARGLVWIEATRIAMSKPPAELAPVAAVTLPPEPAPEVIFSAPTRDETDVPLTTTIRIQFSRDMDAASFRDRVRVSYVPLDADGGDEPERPPLDFTTRYNSGPRVLEIRFPRPLDAYRVLRVEVLDGVAAHDGRAMDRPWDLTFRLGGS